MAQQPPAPDFELERARISEWTARLKEAESSIPSSGVTDDDLGRATRKAEDFARRFEASQRARRAAAALEDLRQSIAVPEAASYDERAMSDITREELNAKLDAAASRTEAAVNRVEGKVDTILAKIDGKLDVMLERREATEKNIARTDRELSNLKYWLAATAVALLLGLGALNYSLVQSTIASFGIGHDVALGKKAAGEHAGKQ
jgi:small-conductance mechanosensitive channel